jgi:hypothetical protein
MDNEEFQNTMLNKILDSIRELNKNIEERFINVNQRLDQLEEKMNTIDLKSDQLEAKNAIRHLEIQRDISDLNIINAKNNYELAKLKKTN